MRKEQNNSSVRKTAERVWPLKGSIAVFGGIAYFLLLLL